MQRERGEVGSGGAVHSWLDTCSSIAFYAECYHSLTPLTSPGLRQRGDHLLHHQRTAQPRGPGEAAPELEAEQSVRGDRVVDAQSSAGD